LEDCARYRFNRLVAPNEVGSHPGHYTLSITAFQKRQVAQLESALQLEEWMALLGKPARAFDPNDVYFFFQLLVGVWPDMAADPSALNARTTDAMLKSLRDAGVNTRWVLGDDGYDNAVRR
jgi:(1->4)-alpha-D-glucan 1-alpha-D-glucosylmutase